MHYNHLAAKRGPEAVKNALANFLRLMIRDRVSIVGGDFNQAHNYLEEVCNELAVPCQIISARSPEVAVVLFFTPEPSRPNQGIAWRISQITA